LVLFGLVEQKPNRKLIGRFGFWDWRYRSWMTKERDQMFIVGVNAPRSAAIRSGLHLSPGQNSIELPRRTSEASLSAQV